MSRVFDGSGTRLYLSKNNGSTTSGGILSMLRRGMSFTWVASVKTTSVALGTIIGMDNGSGAGRVMQFRTTAAGKIDFILFTSGGGTARTWTGGITINDGKWHRAVIMYDGTTGSIFVDGVADTTSAQVAGNTPGAQSAGIGSQLLGVTNAVFNGSLAEIAFISRALSKGEALALSGGMPIRNFQPDHYWPLSGDDPEPDFGLQPIPYLGQTTSVGTGPPNLSFEHPGRLEKYSRPTWIPLVRGGAGASSLIKTVEGLARANVKTVMGVSLASVKTIEGLA